MWRSCRTHRPQKAQPRLGHTCLQHQTWPLSKVICRRNILPAGASADEPCPEFTPESCGEMAWEGLRPGPGSCQAGHPRSGGLRSPPVGVWAATSSGLSLPDTQTRGVSPSLPLHLGQNASRRDLGKRQLPRGSVWSGAGELKSPKIWYLVAELPDAGRSLGSRAKQVT